MANDATLNKDAGRQYPLVAVIPIGRAANADGAPGARINATGTVKAFDVPANAVITGGRLYVDTAWDTTGSAAITIGDDGSATRFLGSTSLKSTGATAFHSAYKYTVSDTVDIVATLADSNGTAGSGRIVLEYVIDGRGNEVRG